MANKKIGTTGIVLIVIGAVLLLAFFWGVSAYNSFVNLDESVSQKWANVQTDYQRRADLIPNLVATVKSYTTYEGTVLTDVTAARSAWTNAQTQTEQMSAANQMDSAISRLLAVVESYPNLKASEQYLSLQDELSGTENRIKISRVEYNTAVKEFNVKVRTFPSNLLAGMFGFTVKSGFEAQAGTENAPDVGSLLN